MSTRLTLRTALIAAVNTLVTPVTVTSWVGDPQEFAAITGSKVYVRYLAVKFSPPQELGGRTYRRDLLYEVAALSTSSDTAIGLLETIEAGLFGTRLASDVGTLRLENHPQFGVPETLIETSAGVYGYLQCWAVVDTK